MNVSQFDPAWIAGPTSAVFVLLTVGWFLRIDINRRNDLDRQDREKERAEAQAERIKTQELHKTSLSELKDTINNMVISHQEVVNKVIAKTEETEKLAERRYELLLTRTFVEKGDPP
jgi:hypothetical protein